jgi:hypothetical protein
MDARRLVWETRRMARPVLRRPEVLLVVALTAAWLPATLRSDLSSVGDVDLVPHATQALGPAARVGTNVALVRAAATRIPAGADYSIVFGGKWKPRHLGGGLQLAREAGASWTQYALAPRFAVDQTTASWLLLRDVSPAMLGIRAGARWRYGSDWLVRVR